MSVISAMRLAALLGQWRLEGPVSVRLAATIRRLVLDGQITVDSRLPPERELARVLGISRASVTAAYDLLRADGYISSRRGAGSWVSIPAGHLAAADSISRVAGIDLRVAALPAPPVLDVLARDAVTQLPRWLDHHGYEPLGLPPLRAAIAERLGARGLPTRPEQVIVTAGAVHALDLAVKALTRRGGEAVVEIPSYPVALDLLRSAGLRPRQVPTTQRGWDLEALEAVARSGHPQLAYLMPDFQNPTGATIDVDGRRRALELLRSGGTYIVIDETFSELWLEEPPHPPPMGSYGDERVITVGSLSKCVWGGLRIGWARAEPAVIQRLASVRATVDLASPILDQLLAVRVLERLDEIMEHRRELLRRRRAALTGALGEWLPDWRFEPPGGGQFIWAELPDPISTSLAVSAAPLGVHLTPGPRFGSAGLLERYLRLPFTLPEEQLVRAVATLAELRPVRMRRPADPTHAYIA